MHVWIKFNVVGVLGFGLQAAAIFVLTHGAHRVGYLLATAMAVELSVLNNFIWHQRWTWKDRPSATTRATLTRFAKFNVTNGTISIMGNLLFMSLLVGRMGLPINAANIVSVVACSICNLVLADRIAFHFDDTSLT
ncbi:MAG: GtrA family protein [Pyrinomonadaceae bacterium]